VFDPHSMDGALIRLRDAPAAEIARMSRAGHARTPQLALDPETWIDLLHGHYADALS